MFRGTQPIARDPTGGIWADLQDSLSLPTQRKTSVLYEVAIVSKKIIEDGKLIAPEKLIYGPVPVTAEEEGQARLVATAAAVLDETVQKLGTNPGNWQIYSRPFAPLKPL